MYQKLLERKLCAKLKQVHPTMQVLKSGEIKHMILNQIYGHLAVFYMSLLTLNLHLELGIWKDFIVKLQEVTILE